MPGKRKAAGKRGRTGHIAKKQKGQKKQKESSLIKDITFRYLLLVLASISNLWIFYAVFKPITLHASGLLLKIFYKVAVYNDAILINNEVIISMVNACIAGAAYYLLLILNLTTAGIKMKKRAAMFIFGASLLLLLNIARTVMLAAMQASNLAIFDTAHKLFWYGLSTIFVVLIWIATIKLFKIKNIPVYSDIISLARNIKRDIKKKS
ncbi:MAG: pacearchaeosortase [archaeon]